MSRRRLSDLQFLSNQSLNAIDVIVDKIKERTNILDVPDITIISMLIQSIEIAKDAVLLMKRDRAASLNPQARILLENLIYLKYITSADSFRRSHLYTLFIAKGDIKDFESFTGDEEISLRIEEEFDINRKALQDSYLRETFNETTAHASIDDFKEHVNRKIEEYDPELLKKGKKWHSDGGRTIRDLAKFVGLETYYVALYSYFSQSVHGKSKRDFFSTVGEKGVFHRAIYKQGQSEVFFEMFLKMSIEIVFDYYNLGEIKRTFLSRYGIGKRFHMRYSQKH